MVSQETILFNDTVANNISLGYADANDENIRRAARIAHAETFINQLPETYQTSIGDRGMRLSGGQRQRLAIARAVVRDPQILLFDEATSALDTESERIVQEAISDVLQDRTAVIVAHRLSTIVNADRILVFEQGCIVEEGTHDALLSRGGVYAKLHAMQYANDSTDQRS
jgi:subfamily B ATP-binding cassette protein MsbA